MTGHVVEEGSQYAKKTRSAERGGGGAGLGFSEMVGRNHSRACPNPSQRREAVKEEAARVVAEGREGGTADGYAEHVALSLSVMDEEKVNIDAVHALVRAPRRACMPVRLRACAPTSLCACVPSYAEPAAWA